MKWKSKITIGLEIFNFNPKNKFEFIDSSTKDWQKLLTYDRKIKYRLLCLFHW